MSERGVLKGMTWRRFTVLLFGLSGDSRTWTALRARKAPPPPVPKGDTPS